MANRIAIVDGFRTPFCKAGGIFADIQAEDLGAYIVRELISRCGIEAKIVDELIFGNVIQPTNAANIARIIAVKGGLSVKTPAYTVNRNCASGLEAIVSAADKISLGKCKVVIAGGTESMSNFPVAIKKEYKVFLERLMRAKTVGAKLKALGSFRISSLVPELPEIFDPLAGLSMGQTAEVLAREFKIDQNAQDRFALQSQQRAYLAMTQGLFGDEIVPMPVPPTYKDVRETDDGPRANQTLEALSKLRPAFNRLTGTVTAGNASPVTDGAASLLLMKESVANERGLTPLGYILDSAEAGLEPSRMGLGPVFAISKLLEKTGHALSDIDLFEINEAFAVQVLACTQALATKEFCVRELGRGGAVGEIDPERLNVNGGAIAIGHPLGASGARLVITLLKELKRRKKHRGIASLCIGGGQGQAMLVEVQS